MKGTPRALVAATALAALLWGVLGACRCVAPAPTTGAHDCCPSDGGAVLGATHDCCAPGAPTRPGVAVSAASAPSAPPAELEGPAFALPSVPVTVSARSRLTSTTPPILRI